MRDSASWCGLAGLANRRALSDFACPCDLGATSPQLFRGRPPRPNGNERPVSRPLRPEPFDLMGPRAAALELPRQCMKRCADCSA